MAEGAGHLVAGRYRLVEELGRGGFGLVWRAHDEHLDRDVAAKRLFLRHHFTADQYQEQRAWSLREARSVARLDHRGIVTLYEVIEHDGCPWIVMEYIRGRPLADVVATGGPLPVRRVAEIGLEMLDALRAAHAAGVVHRDVNPSNIVLSDRGAVLTDFGLAVVDSQTPAGRAGVGEGAPSWIAPERVRGEPAVAASDLWSLGATLQFAMEGHWTHLMDDDSDGIRPATSGEEEAGGPDGPLGLAVQGLLRADPARRLTGEEATRLLERALERAPARRRGGRSGGKGAAPRGAPRPSAAARPGRPRRGAAPLQVQVPRQLPAATDGLVARKRELHALMRLLDEPAGDRAVVATIVGTAGVGKTALAMHWANQVRDRFPDGHLQVDLRGYDVGPPLTAEQALDGFLRALGVAGTGIPVGLDARAALYRSLLEGRRVLVVLDNASSSDQVRPLLPGSPGSVTVVTSRDRLSGLLTRDSAQPLPLELLPPQEANALLGQIVGAARVEAEPAAAAALARLCGRLPLALRIAAERAAASTSSTSLASLVAELSDERARLDLLAAERSERAAVRAVFSWSYQALPPEAARMFRLLGLHPGGDFGTGAVAALTGADPTRARRLLAVLTGAHLLEETEWDRYRFHDLLRLYAAERAAEVPEAERAAALRQVLSWYLHTADAAAGVFSPMRLPVQLDPPVEGVASALAPFTERARALEWCRIERANLVAATRHAARCGEDVVAWKLPALLWDFFSLHGYWADWIATHDVGLEAARRLGDRYGEAWLENNLGNASRGLGRLDEALVHYHQALTLRRQIGHRPGEGWTRYNLGDTYRELGRFDEAVLHLDQALAISRELGQRWTEGYTLNMLGDTYRARGDLQAALDRYRQALRINQEIGHRRGEAPTLHGLADTYRQLDRPEEALGPYQQALTIRREIGDRRGEAHTLHSLADTYRQLDRPELALDPYREALAAFDDLGDPRAAQVRASLESLETLRS
ncbi:MAG TPA: serine/threonine-protein kinase [Actinomycetes bacterium]|nr:serine/threonine-protein kinase [Actinomycetes bacterium]